eukprot:4689488-Amphidinium_carterae.1
MNVRDGSQRDAKSEAEVERLTTEKVNELFDKYAQVSGSRPHLEVEPTIDQVSAIGPRNVKKLHLQANSLQPDCTWKRTEVAGPPDWWKSFRLMKALYLLLDITNIEPLDNYGEKIRDYHDLYGTKCWCLLYQADVRMRSDDFERIRRKLESQCAQALAAGAAGTIATERARKYA